MNTKLLLTFSRFSLRICTTNRNISYVQGQSPDSNSREYFYFVDHQGMLFLDDSKLKNFTSCFKEKRFLQFFFRRLKLNDTATKKCPIDGLTYFNKIGIMYHFFK
ncbi:UPF0598 protein C8orf82 homolog isoform X2 [Argiope bruennichi]|uniref:UPF0598 protein C8orf82 homolog isoform X2 n=1 Tax=Argiope bruennichi TaxID=94029 RepID=UPI002493D9BF|nr:UPF0598 protein C8orf82 homolog isoform X2 [Argiope bruennichi]